MELVRLRDGTEVIVRPVEADDEPLFAAGWERFGEQSRHRRFMGSKAELTPRDLSFLTELDHYDHEALGAIDPATGEGLGIRVFTACLFAGNRSMLRLLERLGTVGTRAVEGAAMEIDVELATDEQTLHVALRSAATGHVAERRS